MEAGTVLVGAPAGSLRTPPRFLRLASDTYLVALVRAGRPAAFEAVYDRHHRAILTFCQHVLGDRHEAEDAVQHTFLSAYNSILSTDQPIRLRPWLFTIARNRCFSILRERREVAVAELEGGFTEEPATLVQRREELRDLVSDLARLPPDQRAALVMAELGSLTHEEIGEALEVPRDKVKALIFQARESLMASRTARETDCADIRQELRTVRGAALRRGNLRRHLHQCSGCREYRRQLRRQPGRLAAVVPVAPSIALKEAVLNATVGGRAATVAGGGGAAVSSALKLGLLKPAVSAVVAVLGAASAVVVVHTVERAIHRPTPAVSSPAPSGGGRRRGGRHEPPGGAATIAWTGRADRSGLARAIGARAFRSARGEMLASATAILELGHHRPGARGGHRSGGGRAAAWGHGGPRRSAPVARPRASTPPLPAAPPSPQPSPQPSAPPPSPQPSSSAPVAQSASARQPSGGEAWSSPSRPSQSSSGSGRTWAWRDSRDTSPTSGASTWRSSQSSSTWPGPLISDSSSKTSEISSTVQKVTSGVDGLASVLPRIGLAADASARQIVTVQR